MVGPAEVTRLGGDVVFIVSAWATIGLLTCVRADFSPVQVTGFLIHKDAEGVTAALGINFRSRVGCARGVEVALRDAVAAVLIHDDAQDSATQVIGVSRGALGITV